MKLYRVVSYVLGFEYDAKELKITIENNRYPECLTVTDIQETDCGEWHDGHELNKHGANFDKYFPDVDAGPLDIHLKTEYQRVRRIMLSQIERSTVLETENRNLREEISKLQQVQELVKNFKETVK